jgi:hypothetical protein
MHNLWLNQIKKRYSKKEKKLKKKAVEVAPTPHALPTTPAATRETKKAAQRGKTKSRNPKSHKTPTTLKRQTTNPNPTYPKTP